MLEETKVIVIPLNLASGKSYYVIEFPNLTVRKLDECLQSDYANSSPGTFSV